MKKILLVVAMGAVLSGCVTREIVRTVQVPSNTDTSTVSTQNCKFITKLGKEKPTDSGYVKLLHRTDGDYIQLMNGHVMNVVTSEYKDGTMLYYVQGGPRDGLYDVGMAYNCR